MYAVECERLIIGKFNEVLGNPSLNSYTLQFCNLQNGIDVL